MAQWEHLIKLQDHSDQQTKVLEKLVGATVLPNSPTLSIVVHRMGDGDNPQVFFGGIPCNGRGVPVATSGVGPVVDSATVLGDSNGTALLT